jgi:hypothetical protein
MRGALLGVVCFATALTGCGVPTDLPGAADALAEAECNNLVHCGGIGASQHAQCKAAFVWQFHTGYYDLFAAYAAHRVVIDGEKLQALVDSFNGDTCSPVGGLPLVGQVGPGGLCFEDVECTHGYCQRSMLYAGCAGTCADFAPTGTDCAGLRCVAEDYCASLTGVPDRCLPLLAAGSACDGEICQPGLYCNCGELGLPQCNGHCDPAPRKSSPGGSCYIGEENCTAGSYCDGSTCQKLRSEGDPCPLGSECGGRYACVDGACRPWLDVGSACDPKGYNGCPADTACDGTSKTCVGSQYFPGAVGATCSDDGACTVEPYGKIPLYCQLSTHTCQPRGALGEACEPNATGGNPCADYATCDPNTRVCALNCSNH